MGRSRHPKKEVEEALLYAEHHAKLIRRRVDTCDCGQSGFNE
jgi:hypothetical protein